MAKYKQYSGKGFTEWIQPIERGYKFACCDCGLVHDLNFQVVDGRAQFQVQRNNRSTALVRRHAGIQVRATVRGEVRRG